MLWSTVWSRRKLRGASRKALSLRCHAQTNPQAVVVGGISNSVDDNSSLVVKPELTLLHFYRIPLIQESTTAELLKEIQSKISDQIVALQTEQCFNIGIETELSSQKLSVLKWLLQETYEPDALQT